MDNILEALKQIDVSNLSYQEWINIGMALKAEGYDCSVWDDWSQNDNRIKSMNVIGNGGALLAPLILYRVVQL